MAFAQYQSPLMFKRDGNLNINTSSSGHKFLIIERITKPKSQNGQPAFIKRVIDNIANREVEE